MPSRHRRYKAGALWILWLGVVQQHLFLVGAALVHHEVWSRRRKLLGKMTVKHREDRLPRPSVLLVTTSAIALIRFFLSMVSHNWNKIAPSGPK